MYISIKILCNGENFEYEKYTDNWDDVKLSGWMALVDAFVFCLQTFRQLLWQASSVVSFWSWR